MAVREIEVTIPSGSTFSDWIGLGDNVLVGLQTPDGWTEADVTFQNKIAENYGGYICKMDGTPIVCEDTVSSRFYALDPAFWIGISELRLRSGTPDSPIDQEADRVVKVMVSPR